MGGEGSVVEERGRAKAKGRPNRLVAEATIAASWIGELGMSWIGWVGELGVGEGKREMGELGVESTGG